MESISLQVPDGSYLIHVGESLWSALASRLAAEPLGARYALITDTNVRPLHAEPLAGALRAAGLQVDVLEFPAGEAHKTRETKAALEDRLVALGVGRDGAVIAVGGGVVGDLAGFVAATYHRGIPYLQIPTTLLAMVDAAIGGKTGHDLPGGKNLIGAFHHPAAVWADLEVLRTLPAEHLRGGLAEVLKCGLVASAALVDELESGAEDLLRGQRRPLRRAVTAAVRIKADVVAADPSERGRRAILNFGHTVGHGLETASGYRLPHGQAVAIGCAVEADLSRRLGLLDAADAARVSRLVERLGLPSRVPAGLDRARALEACRRDKKVRSARIRAVLLRAIGAAEGRDDAWTFPIEEDLLREAMERSAVGPGPRDGPA